MMAKKKVTPEPNGQPVISDFDVEIAKIADLRPHPRNYQGHPDDQLDHLIESIKANRIYRNIVIAQDNVILAGHGVVSAARKMGMDEIPVVRLEFDSDDPRALKVLTGDNEISHLAERDDRVLRAGLDEDEEQGSRSDGIAWHRI